MKFDFKQLDNDNIHKLKVRDSEYRTNVYTIIEFKLLSYNTNTNIMFGKDCNTNDYVKIKISDDGKFTLEEREELKPSESAPEYQKDKVVYYE